MMRSKQSQGVFLLGVGAQKAGTSWLHQQLGARLDTDFGFLKEYHIFDALYHPEYACFKPKQPKPWKWRTWQRNRFIDNPERYFDYFAKKLSHKKIYLTGDITPSYACLTAKTYQLIRNNFKQRNILVRSVFLMRDPIERFLSQHRMQLRKMGKLKPEYESDYLRNASIKLLKRNCLRSNYPTTIDALKDGLDIDEIFIGLYETMFLTSEHNQLCNFLQISGQESNMTMRVNSSPATTVVPEDVLIRLGNHFAPLVEEVDVRCPALQVKEHWKTTQRWVK
tara:strand:+ start:8 stop:847 length:840 start_codon:yes stop_codon:yes gene_type:complete